MESKVQIKNINERILPVNQLEIIANHGKISFENSVNLYNKNINDCVNITKNDIQILDPELDQPRSMTFFNFADFKSKS